VADVVDVGAPGGGPLDVVHVGGGGFTLPRWLRATRPGSTSTVLEIDPDLVRLAQEELGLVLGDDLRVQTGDARLRLRALGPASADVVVGDAFGGRSVPWHLTTRQFVQDVARVLRPDGTYVLNLIDQPPLGFARAEVATLRAVFPHVLVVAAPDVLARSGGGNLVLVASSEALAPGALASAVAERDLAVLAGDAGLDRFVGGADVLTDDHAPVDQLISG
jgi:spermidine synthase